MRQPGLNFVPCGPCRRGNSHLSYGWAGARASMDASGPGDAATKEVNALLILVDGQPERLSLSEIREQIDIHPVQDAQGTTLSAGDARRAQVGRLVGNPKLALLAFVLIAGPVLVIVREGSETERFGMALFMLGGLALLALYAYLHWPRAPAPTFATLPPAGTVIRAGRDGLTVADTTSSWDVVHLYAAGLRRSGRYVPSYVVEHLKLATGAETIVISAAALTRGQEVVDTIFDRLCPEPE